MTDITRRSFVGLIAGMAVPSSADEMCDQQHDWRLYGRAYCKDKECDTPYYLNIYERRFFIHIDEKTPIDSFIQDEKKISSCWGEILQVEHKQVNEKTGVEIVTIVHRWVTPNTKVNQA